MRQKWVPKGLKQDMKEHASTNEGEGVNKQQVSPNSVYAKRPFAYMHVTERERDRERMGK